MTTAKRKQNGDRDPPWEHENPKSVAGKPHHHLTPTERASAARHARAAGRPYPNLVDNMRAAAHTDHPARKPKS